MTSKTPILDDRERRRRMLGEQLKGREASTKVRPIKCTSTQKAHEVSWRSLFLWARSVVHSTPDVEDFSHPCNKAF